MRIVAWIREDGWESVIDAVAEQDAGEITLLHVAAPVHPGPGMLGRHARQGRYAEIAGAAAEGLLADAETRLLALREEARGAGGGAGAGGAAGAGGGAGAAAGGVPRLHRVAVPGRPEDIVTGASEHADLLVMARSGRHPGPHSLGHETRFVVDHAPCTVLLTWP
jgi:nucleotide-binding universal stress UspA family protein